MSLETLIQEAEKLTADERRKLLDAVVRIEVSATGGGGADAIGDLIANPIKLPGFQPLSRDEANAR